MGHYDWSNDYYEPSEGEIFFDELKDKFRTILKEDIKTKLDDLQTENQQLKKQLSEWESKEYQLQLMEHKYNCNIEDLRQEVENEFYNKTVVEVLESVMNNLEVWCAHLTERAKPKCNLCNDNRELVAKFPNGKVSTIKCDCAKPYSVFKPISLVCQTVEFHKSFKKYSSERRMYLRSKYCSAQDSEGAAFHYCMLDIEPVYNEFNNEAKDYHNKNQYDYRVLFSNEAACQQYCDWLNNK